MTCDDGRPCQRCIKRSIGHMCHDEPKITANSTAQQIASAVNDRGGSHHPPSAINANLISLPPTDAFNQMSAYSPLPSTPLKFASAQMGNEFTVISEFLEDIHGNHQQQFNIDGSPLNITEKFYLTAADPSDGTSEARLTQVINAKFEAGFLKPYNYVKGYARLQQFMEKNMTNNSRQRILFSLGMFRPAFRAVAQSLMDLDLVLVEEQFERLLLDYDRVFSSMGIPACLWRRTGEIYKGNKEFASLVGVPIEMLREGRICIYEIMAEESAVNYWEKYGNIAFDPGQKAVLTSCLLKQSIVRPNILSLSPYRCARDDYSSGILLDANENSLGSSLDETRFHTPTKSPTDDHLNRYPDPHQTLVKERLVEFRGVPSTDYLFLGVGSDEVIDLLIRIFCVPGKDKILITPPTYGMYPVSAKINDVEIYKVNLQIEDGEDRFQLQNEQISDALSKNPTTKIIFLCSPGNPTGNALNYSSIKAVLEDPNFHGIVAVDEAYIDFTKGDDNIGSVVKWVEQYPNLIVMQTLSKSFGLAGIRLGIAIGNPKIIRLMNNTKAPYNISTLTSKAALSALTTENISNMRNKIITILSERAKLTTSLKSIPEIKIIGGKDTNFLLVQILDEARQSPSSNRAQWLYRELAEHSRIVVRYRGNEVGCEGCLRITVGTPDENKELVKHLSRLLGENIDQST
ncbi:9030_t:CDS:10 [Ambispora gerdemannii]|uniref:histidinol-phosphate transaminase n=1 Tax=Ambispora gerdemannii TaxID=144530 RepID=A0A9N8WBB5_9GLOM|nr:9030_t:CDS:10 [Ambispora gerdemannii]